MNIRLSSNKRGITIIELLVALVICAIAIGAIYQIFINQSKAYEVQDQVVDIQQNIRSAMEIMVRDLRMAGFDYDNSTSAVTVPNIPYNVAGNSITVWYEYYQVGPPLISEIRAVTYTLNGTDLDRTVNGSTERLLENVDALDLTCGIDGIIGDYGTQDGVVNNWINSGTVDNSRDKVIAVRVSLTTRPEQANLQDDRFIMVSPRTLTSIVALRNLSIKKM